MKTNKLMIYLTTSKSLTDVPKTVAARTRIMIDDKEEKDVRFFEYIVDYQGDHPLLKADYEAPIRGTVPENRKIIAVQKSLGSDSIWVPTRIDKNGHTQSTVETQIAFETQVTDQRNFEIRPMLINPNEWFRVEVYTSAITADAKGSKSPGKTLVDDAAVEQTIYPADREITWSCRIAGVKCPADRYEASDLDTLSSPNSSSPLDIGIYHTGWSVYFIVVFTNFNLILMLLLAKRGRVVRAGPVTQMVLLAFAVFFSMAAAEILADWLIDGTTLSIQGTPAVVLLLIDVLLFILLALDVAQQRSKIRKAPQPSDTEG